ncbi:MAG: hypothetical protein JO040_12780 [Gemmatimonadetes bacterium]|nr:hypothetical protein [Gemmatimonadota bacterium]
MSDLKEVKELLDEINQAISSYDPVLKERARDILIERAFGPSSGSDQASASAPAPRPRGRPRKESGGEGGEDSADLGSLLSRWNPSTMSDKALLGAYYLSQVRGDENVTSQAINSELKRNGLAISNITRAIEANMRPDRPLMVQEKKMGSTKQARKQYRITPAGVDAVERRLRGS